MKKFIFLLFVLCYASIHLYASSLNIETDYRNRVLSYSNLDFDNGTSTDSISYSTQRLKLSLSGTFDTGSSGFGEQVEICTRLQALEIIGSSTSVPFFPWQNELPYPGKDFLPFIEHSYVRISNLTRSPVELTIGRQPLEYGSGLIVSDNGMGFDALRLTFQYPKKINFDILLGANIKTGFIDKGNFDLTGLTIAGPWKDSNFEIGYFQETDRSGTMYTQAQTTDPKTTKLITKEFYDFRLGKIDDLKYYSIEAVFQQGELITQDNTNISLGGGFAYVFSGGVTQKRAKGVTVSYRLTMSVASGDDDITSLTDDDKSFSPTFGKKFDGLELDGYGTFLGLSPTTTLLDVNRQNFSGFNVIAFGASYSPVYGLEYGFDGFMFSASESRHTGAPGTSNFEKNILGSKYNLGSELNGFIKYSPSKYINFQLSYARYTPPTYIAFWPKSETCDMYLLTANCKF